MFSLSLSVSHVDVFLQIPSFLCVPSCFLLFFVSSCLSCALVSLSLTPSSSLRSDQQRRRRVKFSLFFLLIPSPALSVSSESHVLPLFIHASSQLEFVLCLSFPLSSIVHHGTARARLFLVLTCIGSSAESMPMQRRRYELTAGLE